MYFNYKKLFYKKYIILNISNNRNSNIGNNRIYMNNFKAL